jgi:hypothetical protein
MGKVLDAGLVLLGYSRMYIPKEPLTVIGATEANLSQKKLRSYVAISFASSDTKR